MDNVVEKGRQGRKGRGGDIVIVCARDDNMYRFGGGWMKFDAGGAHNFFFGEWDQNDSIALLEHARAREQKGCWRTWEMSGDVRGRT